MTTEQAVARVMEHVTRDRLAEAICGIVDIPSPTGAEGRVAAWFTRRLGSQNASVSHTALSGSPRSLEKRRHYRRVAGPKKAKRRPRG